MTQYIEDFLPPIQSAGLNTATAVSFSSTLTVTGATTQTGLLTATAGVTSPAGFIALNATSTTSGGSTVAALKMGSGAYGIYFGAGVPTITAAQGSAYLRVDGSSTTNRFYINTNGATSWTGLLSVA